jgi:hypothetical protein
MRALMTNRKSPNVNMVIGNVSMTRMGLTKRFNKPRTIASMSAVTKDCMCTPLKIYESAKATTAEMIILKTIFITADFNPVKIQNPLL